DASKYAGIAFKAKVAPGTSTSVRFNIGDINTHPNGNICTSCWNHFGKDLILTTEWKEYKIMFADARQQPDWGVPRPLSLTPSKLIEIDWQIGPGRSYDIWVDDITFLDCK
ncbi:MAG TPA: carbohydrate binding domain-containing protein, partial [Polyangia bacterium]|nr:carbohydrate binding domain-containing protein [Polyangia bacterium]